MSETAFGRYRLLSLIGEGGMGRVYKAHDTVIDRDVAIKVLPPELAAEPGYRERFRREAYTAARLSEPHIIPIYDTGEFEGQLYLVMPVVDGIDLEGVLKRHGKLSPQRAVSVIEQLAAALDAAHAVGLVHRDVKPSNALLTGRDFAYLIDFGIAHDVKATKMTRTGFVVGSFAYMAPERFTSDSDDARADIYALTCVLYECLTGVQPYPGDSLQQQVGGHIALEPPTPTSLDPTIPAGFGEVIARGMAKNPEQRYPSAHELATAARNALSTAPLPHPHTAPAMLDSSQPPAPPAALTPTQAALAPSVARGKVNPYDIPAVRPPSTPRVTTSVPQRTPTAHNQPQNRHPDRPPPPSGTSAPGSPAPGSRRRRRKPLIIGGVAVLVTIIAVVAGYSFGPYSPESQTDTASTASAATPGVQSPEPVAPTAQEAPAGAPPAQPPASTGPTVLPFIRPANLAGVAVDSAGSVYLAAGGNGPVLTVAAGATASVELPFTEPVGPGIAVDTANAVYVSDYGGGAVWKLPAGSNSPTAVSFNGMKCGQFAAPLKNPRGVAVDKAGAVYVVDYNGCEGGIPGRVLMLPVGSNTPTTLPFTDLHDPSAIAVDGAGDVYVVDKGNDRVLELTAGSSREAALPFTGLRDPGGVVVNATGDVYVSDTGNGRVLKLAAGSTNPTELSVPDLLKPMGLAVDDSGNLYIADNGSRRVLKLAPDEA